MKVKILVFPLSVSIALYMAIFMIQPEFQKSIDEKDALEKKQAELAVVEEKVKNSGLLDQDLSTNKEMEDFALRYLPMASDDERIVDSLNFLAAQSNVAIASIKIESVKESVAEEAALEEEMVSDAGLFADPAADPNAKPAPQKPIAKKVLSEVTLNGSYEGIRDFVGKVARSDRFQTIQLVDVNQGSGGEGDNAAAYDNSLEASVKVEFAYLPKVKNTNQSNNDIFSRAAFDFETVRQAKQSVTSPVPVMDAGVAGKNNPFVR